MDKPLTTKVRKVVVDENRDGQRIDNFLMAQYRSIPKTHIYKILRKGEVRVNSKRIKPDYRLQAGDEVRLPPLRAPEQQAKHPSDTVKQMIEKSILFEDDNLMIINKPANIAVHGGTTISAGVIDALRVLRPKQKFLELAHRLDKATSGCLIIAKKRAVLVELHDLFKQNKITKIYRLLTKGHWSSGELFVDVPLIKHHLTSGERVVRVSKEGKPSKTQFKVLQVFHDATLLEAKLLTGRTHQIRVHAVHCGYPIAGDAKYGDEQFNQKMKEKLSLHRLFLHAYHLEFYLSSVEKKISVTAPLDAALLNCLKRLEKVS